MAISRSSLLGTLALSALLAACSATDGGGTGGSGSDSDGDGGDGDPDPGTGSGAGGGLGIPSGNSGGASSKPPAMIAETLPDGFTANAAVPQTWECSSLPNGTCFAPAGGFRRVGPLAEVALEESNSCRNVLRGIVRDFDASHADFGGDGDGADVVNTGLVNAALGSDRKPVPSGANATVASAIGDWFTNDAGGNVPYVVDFWLQPVGEMYVFDSSRFFPLEGVGTSSGNDNDGGARNFLFTTELHTAFEYKGGEVFTFTGDDDVFVFINGVIAVDLGGVHSQKSHTVDIDVFATANGMTAGNVYTLDLFHAERNPTGSNFRIETSLDFQECGVLAGDIIIR